MKTKNNYFLSILPFLFLLLLFSNCETEEGTGSISGTIFNDVNINNLQEEEEENLENILVKMTFPNGTSKTTFTDSVGRYEFGNLMGGIYIIQLNSEAICSYGGNSNLQIDLDNDETFFNADLGTKKLEEHNVALRFRGMLNGENFSFGQIDKNHDELSYIFERFDFYVSNIKLIDANGTETLLSKVDLYDLNCTKPITNQIPVGTYTAVKIGLGLNETLNASDPTLFEPGHPLSYVNSEHYWSWATRYIFLMVEGKIGTANGSLDDIFLYHLGKDDLYEEVVLERNTTVTADEVTNIDVIIDVDKLFYNENTSVDMMTDNVSHTNDSFELASEIYSNFAKAVR
ncbi:MAG: MbnP family protein [Chitinophagales bacterium]